MALNEEKCLGLPLTFIFPSEFCFIYEEKNLGNLNLLHKWQVWKPSVRPASCFFCWRESFNSILLLDAEGQVVQIHSLNLAVFITTVLRSHFSSYCCIVSAQCSWNTNFYLSVFVLSKHWLMLLWDILIIKAILRA